MASFDPDLISRYECLGPRYTSYPTAVQFKADFGEEAYRDAAAASGRSGTSRPLSLYAHLPFCVSPCFYCACNRIITRSPGRMRAYLNRLHREIELHAALFEGGRPVEQLHFGGGTPTSYTVAELAALIEHMGRHFALTSAASREYSIEIDPRTVDTMYVRGLAALGFNRVSLGIQDFDVAVQGAINRMQSIESTVAVVEAARRVGIRSVGFDLIYGLPRQTISGFESTLNKVLDIRPDRVAVYAYAHVPQVFKAQRRLTPHGLPTPEVRLELLGLSIEMLGAAGYVYIGMDHFALPDDELARAKRQRTLHRNFQGYSTHADTDLVAIGVSAIGRVGDAYAQNQKLLPDYYAAIDAGRLPIQRGIRLNDDDRVRAFVIQELMCHESVDIDDTGRRFGIDFKRYFSREIERLQELQADGLTYVDGNRIGITDRGRLLMRNVAMTFDAYIAQPATATSFSKAI